MPTREEVERTAKHSLAKENVPRWTIRCATLFGLGNFPKGSGTLGSAVALVIHAALHYSADTFYNQKPVLQLLIDLALVIPIIPFGIYVCNYGEAWFGKKDDGRLIIDEVAGYWLNMFLVPLSWPSIFVGFFVCRIFDILKPPPAWQSQKLPRGKGVMVDDLIAAVYGNIVMQIIFRVFWV